MITLSCLHENSLFRLGPNVRDGRGVTNFVIFPKKKHFRAFSHCQAVMRHFVSYWTHLEWEIEMCIFIYYIYIIFRCEILRNQVNPILQNTSLCKMHCCTELDFKKQQSFRRMQSLKLIHCSLFISDRKSVEAKDFGPCISLLVLCCDCTSVYFNLQWSKITMVQ